MSGSDKWIEHIPQDCARTSSVQSLYFAGLGRLCPSIEGLTVESLRDLETLLQSRTIGVDSLSEILAMRRLVKIFAVIITYNLEAEQLVNL